MRNRSILALGLAGILTISACSSSTDGTAKTKPAANSDNSSANANTLAVANGVRIDMPQPTDANTVAPTAASDQLGTTANKMDARIQAMRDQGATGPQVDPAKVALQNAKPAPDNSTFTSYLTDAGYEIRTFKSHPQLLKVEKKTVADGTQSLKIFLRDGRVVELPGQRITVLSTATAAFILETAGVKPAQPKQPASGTAPAKKSGE